MSPRLHLAIDNCFASKRWCEPDEWMPLVKELGLKYVEASADNEIDPLYSTAAHVGGWMKAVRRVSEKTGVFVVNLYSGHGTYSTLGLGHHDGRVREHLVEDWVRPMLRTAGALGAGLGFFAHAFSEKTLCDRRFFEEAYETLIGMLHGLSLDAERYGVSTFGVEQMYSPHQVPWTIEGAADFLRRTNSKSRGLPVYITIDTGHQSGQRNFLPPTEEEVERFVEGAWKGRGSNIYVGPKKFYDQFAAMVRNGAGVRIVKSAVAEHVEKNPHLFSSLGDGDTYRWLEEFAAYSPIIHLQQTDGTVSAHRNFTSEANRWGIIRADRVLAAIKECYRRPRPRGFPPKAENVYLTLEPFLPTACHPRLMLDEIAQSVAYWRRYVPRDGADIKELCSQS